MTRHIYQNINTMVQVLDANGDKVTDAVVNYKVYNRNYETGIWEVARSGLMAHVGDGIYSVAWIPFQPGEHTFYAYCTSPKFHESYTYDVADFQVRDYTTQAALNGGNSTLLSDSYYAVLFYPYNEDYVQRKIYYFKIRQTNNEAQARTINVVFNLDNVRSINMALVLDNNTWYYIQIIGALTGSNYDYAVTANKIMILQTQSYLNGDLITGGVPLECRNFDVQVQCSSRGTNQWVYGEIMTSAYRENIPNDD